MTKYEYANLYFDKDEGCWSVTSSTGTEVLNFEWGRIEVLNHFGENGWKVVHVSQYWNFLIERTVRE